MAGKGINPSKGRRSKPSRPQPQPQAPPQSQPRASQGIPDAVANRMARRIAVATGVPTLLGMGVFIGSYLLVSREILDVPPGATLAASGACFLLGVIGLSYGVLSASWEEQPGSLLGSEQVGVNFGRLRQSVGAMRSGSGGQQR